VHSSKMIKSVLTLGSRRKGNTKGDSVRKEKAMNIIYKQRSNKLDWNT